MDKENPPTDPFCFIPKGTIQLDNLRQKQKISQFIFLAANHRALGNERRKRRHETGA